MKHLVLHGSWREALLSVEKVLHANIRNALNSKSNTPNVIQHHNLIITKPGRGHFFPIFTRKEIETKELERKSKQ